MRRPSIGQTDPPSLGFRSTHRFGSRGEVRSSRQVFGPPRTRPFALTVSEKASAAPASRAISRNGRLETPAMGARTRLLARRSRGRSMGWIAPAPLPTSGAGHPGAAFGFAGLAGVAARRKAGLFSVGSVPGALSAAQILGKVAVRGGGVEAHGRQVVPTGGGLRQADLDGVALAQDLVEALIGLLPARVGPLPLDDGPHLLE